MDSSQALKLFTLTAFVGGTGSLFSVKSDTTMVYPFLIQGSAGFSVGQ